MPNDYSYIDEPDDSGLRGIKEYDLNRAAINEFASGIMGDGNLSKLSNLFTSLNHKQKKGLLTHNFDLQTLLGSHLILSSMNQSLGTGLEMARRLHHPALIAFLEGVKREIDTTEMLAKEPTLAEAIAVLNVFSEQDVNISNIIENLNKLASPTGEEKENDKKALVENSRSALRNIFYAANTETSKKEAAYQALLALARFSPENTEDPIHLHEIDDEDRVVIADGKNFSLQTLIHAHDTRRYRNDPLCNLDEYHNSKWLINPVTNFPFHPRDARHIVDVARVRNLEINNLHPDALTVGHRMLTPAETAAIVARSRAEHELLIEANQREEQARLARANRSVLANSAPANQAAAQPSSESSAISQENRSSQLRRQLTLGVVQESIAAAESKDREEKQQLSETQIRVTVTEVMGDFIPALVEYRGMDRGTRNLYLRRAIQQDCRTFNESLDKLFDPSLEDTDRPLFYQLQYAMRILKSINDLFFNNEINQAGSYRSALSVYFPDQECSQETVQRILSELVNECINQSILADVIRDRNVRPEMQIHAVQQLMNDETERRLHAEASILPQTDWRIYLDLPASQQTPERQTAIGQEHAALVRRAQEHVAAIISSSSLSSPQPVNRPRENSGLQFFPSRRREEEATDRGARIMRETVAALSEQGLTEEMLRSNWVSSSPYNEFSELQQTTLTYLMTGRRPAYLEESIPILPVEMHLTPEQAIQEINRLSIYQLHALQENYVFGLRGDHLRNWQGPPTNQYFSLGHSSALNLLFRNQHLTPEQAMVRINGKTDNGAWDIYRSALAAPPAEQPSSPRPSR